MFFGDRLFRVVATSRSAEKKGQQANYLLMKPQTFDLPRVDLVLRDGTTAPGFEGSGIELKSTVRAGNTDFEVAKIDDDDVEPWVRLSCNRKQNNSVT